MKLENYFSGLEDLNQEDLLNLNGGTGESLWYWIAYGVAATTHGTVTYINTVRDLNSGLIGVK